MSENHPTFEKCTVCGATNFAKYVVIPHEEWEAVKRELKSVLTGVQSPPDQRRKARSPIDRNPELSEFLLEMENSATQNEIRQLVREKFGSDFVPSSSALCRFYQRMWMKNHSN